MKRVIKLPSLRAVLGTSMWVWWCLLLSLCILLYGCSRTPPTPPGEQQRMREAAPLRLRSTGVDRLAGVGHVTFLPRGKAIAAGADKVWRTHDYGRTWSAKRGLPCEDLGTDAVGRAWCFTSTRTFEARGEEHLYVSEDVGESWFRAVTPAGAWHSPIGASGMPYALFLSDDGWLWRLGAGKATAGQAWDKWRALPGSELSWGVVRADGWYFFSSEKVFLSTNAGASWSEWAMPSSVVAMGASKECWALLKTGVLLRTRCGVHHWQRVFEAVDQTSSRPGENLDWGPTSLVVGDHEVWIGGETARTSSVGWESAYSVEYWTLEVTEHGVRELPAVDDKPVFPLAVDWHGRLWGASGGTYVWTGMAWAAVAE